MVTAITRMLSLTILVVMTFNVLQPIIENMEGELNKVVQSIEVAAPKQNG